MDIFDFDHYKNWVNARISQMPQRGRGQYKKIAELLGISAVVVSQVFKGPRELSLENAMEISVYFALTELETDYFLTLVEKERSGSHKLKIYFETKIRALKKKRGPIERVVKRNSELNKEIQAVYYSDWVYSAVKLLSMSEDPLSLDEITAILNLPLQRTKNAAEFLIRHNLVHEERSKLRAPSSLTHLGPNSPFLSTHLQNWRTLTLSRIDRRTTTDIFYSGPMMIEPKYYMKIRGQILEFIKEFSRSVEESESRELACLNLDFFKII